MLFVNDLYCHRGWGSGGGGGGSNVCVDNGSLITDFRMDDCQGEQGHTHSGPALSVCF